MRGIWKLLTNQPKNQHQIGCGLQNLIRVAMRIMPPARKQGGQTHPLGEISSKTSQRSRLAGGFTKWHEKGCIHQGTMDLPVCRPNNSYWLDGLLRRIWHCPKILPGRPLSTFLCHSSRDGFDGGVLAGLQIIIYWPKRCCNDRTTRIFARLVCNGSLLT